MYVISTDNKRTDEPKLDTNECISSDWSTIYKKGPIDILMTNVTYKSHIVTVRGCIYENINSSLTEITIGSVKIPIIDAKIVGKKGNKTIVDIRFMVSSSDVLIIDTKTWSFKFYPPIGFELNTLVSEKCTIMYVHSYVTDPIAVGVEISPVSFTLMWPECGKESTVTINGKNTSIISNRMIVTSKPETEYLCVIKNEKGEYNIDIKTPCASINSYRKHYRSCKKQFHNGYIFDLTQTDPFVISELRKYGIINQGDTLFLNDSCSGENHILTAVGNGGTVEKRKSFYIIPSFEHEDEQCVCMDDISGPHVIKFDRTESFVKYKDIVYNHGEKFTVGDQTVNVVKGSIVLVFTDIEEPIEFPGGVTTSSQVQTSGDVIMRDLIMRSSYQVTEKMNGDYTYGQSSFFVYDASLNSTKESTRITHILDDSQTTGGVAVDLLYTPETGDGYLHRSISVAPAETTLTTIDSSGSTSATFDTNGLKFNSNTADIYFGENQEFRIHYEPENGNDPSMLQIQGYDTVSSSYITRQLITNSGVN